MISSSTTGRCVGQGVNIIHAREVKVNTLTIVIYRENYNPFTDLQPQNSLSDCSHCPNPVRGDLLTGRRKWHAVVAGYVAMSSSRPGQTSDGTGRVSPLPLSSCPKLAWTMSLAQNRRNGRIVAWCWTLRVHSWSVLDRGPTGPSPASCKAICYRVVTVKSTARPWGKERRGHT